MLLQISLPIIAGLVIAVAQAQPEVHQNVSVLSRQAPKCSCGKQSMQTKIVGGTQSKKNEFIWRVAMFARKTFSGYSYHCSGALIDNRWVLTAAHCVDNKQASQLILSIGDHDLKSNSETKHEVKRVSKIHVHPNYNTRNMEGDIALLQLDSPVTYSDNIGPICLPLKNASKTFAKEKATTSGWGVLKEGSSSTPGILQKADLDVISNQDCSRTYSSLITDNKLCTLTRGVDACQGDSGSSLDYYDAQTRANYVIGVVSFGRGCAKANTPGVFTRTTKYTSWIQQNTGANFCSP